MAIQEGENPKFIEEKLFKLLPASYKKTEEEKEKDGQKKAAKKKRRRRNNKEIVE